MQDSPDVFLIDLLARFAPIHKWSSEPDSMGIVVAIYRVYKEPFKGKVSYPSAIQIIDYDPVEARAVFVRTRIRIPDYEQSHHMFPTPEGGLRMGPQESWVVLEDEEFMVSTNREIWRDSGEGLFLLVMTPSLTGTGTSNTATGSPYSVEITLNSVRAAVMLNMGRNAAFEQVCRFEVVIDEQQRRLNALTTGRNDPENYDEPKIDGFASQRSVDLMKKLYGADEDIKNRVSLAFRWYMKAQRHPVPSGELRMDIFIYYWIAFEALAMPNEKYYAALEKLAEIHSTTVEKIKDIFPIGRLQGLRARILHRGEVYPLDIKLSDFMDALCVDMMMYLLEIVEEPRTKAYLDGSANNLLPEVKKQYKLPQ